MKKYLLLYYDDSGSGSGGGSSLIGPIIAGASAIGGAAINASQQGSMNSATLGFAKAQFDEIRQENIADWWRNANYNSPAQQMQRLKAAGLNPNLVYGNGQAIQNAPQMHPSQPVSWNPKAPQYGDIVPAAMQGFLQQQQLQNQEAQNQVLLSQAHLNEANAKYLENYKSANTAADTDLKTFSLNLNNATYDVQIALKTGAYNKLLADTTFTLDENQRQAMANPVSIKEGLTRILNLDAQRANTIAEKQAIAQKIALLEKDNTIKQLDIDYINATGNTGRPNEGGIAKMVELLYGKIFNNRSNPQEATKNIPGNVPGHTNLEKPVPIGPLNKF